MSPRIQRLSSDWKTYVALIGAVSAAITAFTGLFNQFKNSIDALHDLPAQAKWVAALILAALALFLAIAAWSRRSILLRPDRFIVSADDPEQLKGRTIEVEALAKECEANPLVFLEGESGTGKSALVRAGLAAFLVDPAEKRQLIPVLLDASSLSWKEGLRIQLSRAVAGLSSEDRAQLGAPEQFGTDDVFREIGALPRHVPRRLLLILDQVDDYVVAHRNYMLRENKVLTSDELVQASPDWSALANLVTSDRLHLLLVCRNDIFSRLDSFRFAKVASFTLWRIDKQLITPLLDQVTEGDGKGAVVENPEYGWLQLKSRLLRDLSAGTQHILPIQLAVALDSLRRFRTLTLGEYARNEGARGLERLHIERHLSEIARSRRIDEGALLRGLMLLVIERGQKTQRATRQAFCNEVLSGGPPNADLLPVIEHLIRWRILRYQLSDDGEYLLLHHDFLARGVWEAHRQANRWAEFLRQRSREFKDALTWLQRWRALLPPIAQLRLLGARVRRRFSFGEHRAFAFWSVLRFVPLIAFLVCSYFAYVWVDIMRQEQFAEGIFAGLGTDDVDENEARDWASLAAAKEEARLRAVRRGLAKPAVAAKLSDKASFLVHALIGLDPTGQFSRSFARQIVLPTIRDYRTPNDALSFVVKCIELLRLGHAETNTIATALIERMKTEKDIEVLSSLAKALGSLSGKPDTKAIQPLATALVERMKTEKDSESLSSLGKVLGSLSGKLDPKDVQPAAAALVQRMSTEKDTRALSRLGQALASLSEKLDPKDVQPLAAALVERMKTEKDSESLSSLGKVLGSLSGKLDAKDVQRLAAVLVERMKTEKDSESLSSLGKVLGSLSEKLDAKDIQPLAAALVERMKTEKDSESLSSLGKVLGSLSGKLDPKDVQPAAAALVQRMSTEKDTRALSRLGQVLASLSEKLDPKDVQPLAAALVERIKTEINTQNLFLLDEALGNLSEKLDAKDIQPLAAALVERMKTEKDSESLSSLGKVLGSLSGKLDPKDVQPAAAALVQRMSTEKDTRALSRLGQALASLSEKLDPKDVQPLAAALVERMKTEKDSESLSSLGKVLGSLSGKLDAKDVQRLAAVLVERMKTEKDSEALFSLGNVLSSLSEKLDPKDVQPAVVALVGQMKAEKDSRLLSSLGKTLVSFGAILRVEEAQTALGFLSERWYEDHGRDASTEDWISLEVVADRDMDLHGRIQKYVDLLALPLIIEENRKTLVDGLEALSGAKFDGNMWRFVDWATMTDKGKSMKLELEWRRH
jgi:predicted sugar kinase/membrane protein implicated in regulation of membrane protease activity